MKNKILKILKKYRLGLSMEELHNKLKLKNKYDYNLAADVVCLLDLGYLELTSDRKVKFVKMP